MYSDKRLPANTPTAVATINAADAAKKVSQRQPAQDKKVSK